MEQNTDRYSFDAPSEAVDLVELHNASCDEDWFEKREKDDLSSFLTEAPPASDAPPSNIVTSWGDSKPQPQRVSKRKMESSGPPVKKQKKSPEAQTLRRSTRRSPQGPALRRSTRRSPQGPEKKSTTVSKSLRATKSASCLPSTSTQLSSEEMEVQRMKRLQKEVSLHRKKNEASYRAALAGNPPPVKLSIAPTIPREFNFQTDTRIKSVPNGSATGDGDFIQQLRKPCSPLKASKGPTVPKPFNLSTSRSRKESAPYVSIAQQIQNFESRTPERYHQPSRQATQRGPSPVKASHRPTVKRLTVPEGFQLQIEKRLQERQTKKPPAVEEEEEEEEEEPHVFKSQPVSKKILEGVVGVPEKRLPSLTVPESPAFALKKRVRPEPQVQVRPPSPIRVPPVPHFGLPFQPKLPEQHHVELCPFSFDSREQQRRALREKKLQQLRSQEVPKFKAKPLPDFSEVLLPEKNRLEVTRPEPFNLLIDTRGADKTSRFENMVQEELKQQEEATHFKARPNVVTQKDGFKPKERGGDTGCVAASGFQLMTERRALERQDFDRRVNEKEALMALMAEQQKREEEEREKEEVSRLRQEQVHKAQPVKHFRGVKLKKSEMPLTLPQTPNFSDRFKM